MYVITSAAVARKLVLSKNSVIQQQGWGISKSGVAPRILAGAPEVVEKGVALKVGEKSASHLTLIGPSCPSSVRASGRAGS